MNNRTDIHKYIDHFAQIVSLCVSAKYNLNAITEILSRSQLVSDIEENEYSLMYEYTPYQNFKTIFPDAIVQDNSYQNFNDAYWCGFVYMNIMYEYKKPLTYIFYIMPLELLLDLYPVYHEMDISQIYERFEKEEQQESLLSRLLRSKNISATQLASKAKVPVKTIYHYKDDNKYLYKASFQTIMKLARALDVNPSVFLESL